MSHIKVGDRVRFRAGRGYTVGRVSNIDTGRALPVVVIATEKGKIVNRLLSAVALAESAAAEPPHSLSGVTESGEVCINGIKVNDETKGE